jgi:hypothetical protein
MLVTMRARHAIRALANPDDGHLPVWATAPLPQPHLDLVNSFGQADDWPSIKRILTLHHDILRSAEFRQTLTAFRALYVDNPVAGQLAALLDEIDDFGLDPILAHYQADHDRRALLNDWISTTTWPESFAFLDDHAATLTGTEFRELLAEDESEIAQQHLAILDLVTQFPIERVQAIVVDANTAEEAAFDAIEQGNLTLLKAISMASVALQDREITSAIIAVIDLVATDSPEQASTLARQIAEHATKVQRRANAIRLTALRQRKPELSALDEIIKIIRPSDQPD